MCAQELTKLKKHNLCIIRLKNFIVQVFIPFRKVESCPEREKDRLNVKLKKMFKDEFQTSSETEALEEKFHQLDRNSDGKLSKNELKPIIDLRKWI